MSNNDTSKNEVQKLWSLKIQEPKVSSEDPWRDDALGRDKIAKILTNLIKEESNSLIISLSGNWGTGKTFFLKRWQKELEKEESGQKPFQVIYFNAWEDDFCDDPFVAIIGQLAGFLKKHKRDELKTEIVEIAKELIKQNIPNIVHKTTGISLDPKNSKNQYLEEYEKQNQTKINLKESLTEISTKVRKETGHPLIFIIDELDRCRPTFAVELLERVKHIFDMPNVIFIFGINRDELCSSIESIYGEIDATVYLRRFFDMEFVLPVPDAKNFCKHLMKKYELEEFFEFLNSKDGWYIQDTRCVDFLEHLPTFCEYLDVSLRDIDYCVRTIILIGKTYHKRDYMHPFLVSTLLILRLKNNQLYRQFMQENIPGSQVLDYINSVISENLSSELYSTKNILEAIIYMSYREDFRKERTDRREKTNIPFRQLQLLAQEKELSNSQKDELLNSRFLSKEIKEDKERAREVYKLMQSWFSKNQMYISLRRIYDIIELSEGIIQS